MNLSAAMSILAKAGYVSPTSEHYQTEREMVASAIEAAVRSIDPQTNVMALKWAGLPCATDDDEIRFSAAIGYLVGVMKSDANISDCEPPKAPDPDYYGNLICENCIACVRSRYEHLKCATGTNPTGNNLEIIYEWHCSGFFSHSQQVEELDQ